MPGVATVSSLPLPTHAQESEVLDLLGELTAIGSPTFAEAARSEFVFQWLRKACGSSVARDDLGNVWVDFSGGARSVCLLDAHLDTVFPESAVAIRRETSRWHAPGIFDNTAACAQLMLWARETARQNGPRPFLATWTVGEEGPGNLRGIRAMITRFRPRLDAAMVFDLELDSWSRRAVGSVRYRLQWSGPGGHSWNDFGTPSAIHRAAAWIQRLPALFPWRQGLNTFNIGTIDGGTGVNVIASGAAATLDVRSADDTFLETFATWIEARPAGGDSPDLATVTGRRPAGDIPQDHALVDILRIVHQELGLGCTEQVLSTNGNALLAAGIPTIVTGLAGGSNVHRPDEYLDISSLGPGRDKLDMLTDRWEALL